MASWTPHSQSYGSLLERSRAEVAQGLHEAEMESLKHGIDIREIEQEYMRYVQQAAEEERNHLATREAQAQSLQEARERQQKQQDAIVEVDLQPTATSSSSSAGVLSPSAPAIVFHPVKEVTWDAFTHEATSKFREFCATRLRHESTAGGFEPQKFITDKVLL